MKTISKERYEELRFLSKELSKETVHMANAKYNFRGGNYSYQQHKIEAANEIIYLLQNRSNLNSIELNIIYVNLIIPFRSLFIKNFLECCGKVDAFSTMNTNEIKRAYNNLYLRCNKYKNSWERTILLLSNVYSLEKGIVISKIEETFMFHPTFNNNLDKELESKKSLSLR